MTSKGRHKISRGKAPPTMKDSGIQLNDNSLCCLQQESHKRQLDTRLNEVHVSQPPSIDIPRKHHNMIEA